MGSTGIGKGSIGSFSGKKWTKETCTELALQCKTLKEFKKKS